MSVILNLTQTAVYVCLCLCMCWYTFICVKVICLSCRYLGCYLLVWHCCLGSILESTFEFQNLNTNFEIVGLCTRLKSSPSGSNWKYHGNITVVWRLWSLKAFQLISYPNIWVDTTQIPGKPLNTPQYAKFPHQNFQWKLLLKLWSIYIFCFCD